MRNKVAVAVSTALMTVSLSSAASVDIVSKSSLGQSITIEKNRAVKSLTNSKSIVNTYNKKFVAEENLAAGVYTYIVRLKDMPLATYDGSIAGLAATNPQIAKKELFAKLAKSKMNAQQIRNELRLDTKSKDSVQYANFLASKQADFLTQAQSKLGKNAKVVYQYKNAFNGVALNLTQAEAAKLSSLSSVAFVERERMEQMDTDTGPTHIGAPQVWEGEGPTATNMGEGVIIGVIDSGINSDHASFADIGGDGYDHTNPWGEGVYVGDCAGDFASMCNDKLIGVRSYASVTDDYDDVAVFGDTPPAKNGEDYGGHGSHTASTAGGNILKNVNLQAPDTGEAVSDGIVNESIIFDQVSGVAPHANIVAYQICSPGDRGDTYSGCPSAAIIAALDDAVTDGVDVLNYSISGGGNPWTSSTELGFLAAQQAGIFSAVSAGNDGPDANTTSKNSPWYTIVGASTHSRVVASFLTYNDEEYSFRDSSGTPIASTLTGNPILSLDVDAANFEGCSAYAAGTFTDAIALISRGSCSFVDKVTNATDAGATAVIVYNNKEFSDLFGMAGLENTTIPAIGISQTSGTLLLAELAANPDMEISIDPTVVVGTGPSDNMASFSSRGPNNTVPNIMTPSVTAPGVSIYAAYSDEQYGHDVTGTAPSDYNFLSGTSMSAPHTSGAGAVLKSAHPTWTPDNIRSALMLTAITDVRKEDGVTSADVFDMGSGSIRVNLATNTGLVMNETFANYMKANPSVSGKPETLNIPSMANTQCIDTCSWTRTFTATKDGSWAVATNTPATGTEEAPIASKMALTVTPTSFDILAGETQTITVTADVSASAADVWNFGDVTLTSAGMPDARLPVLVQVADNNLPSSLSVTASRMAGSFTFSGLMSNDLVDPVVGVFDKTSDLIAPSTVNVAEDGLDFIALNFTEVVPNIVFSTASVTAPDVDLRILDSTFANIGSSAGPTSDESVAFVNLPADTYYIVVDGYQASTPGGSDDVVISVSSILTDEDSKNDNVTAMITENGDYFDVTVNWADNTPSSSILALTSADDSYSVQIPLNFVLGESDVVEDIAAELMSGLQTMEPGVAQPVAFNIAPNFTNSDKVYTLVAEVTEGQEISNVNNDGVVEGNMVTWMITRAAGESTEMLSVGFDLIPRTASTGNEVVLSNTLGSDTVMSTYSFGVVEVAPVAMIMGLSNGPEESVMTMNASSSYDENSDELTYTWLQLGGSPVTFDSSAENISFDAPKVTADETISFQLTVEDGNGNSSTTAASAVIRNKPKNGGSFGWLLLLVTPMLFTRRKKA